MSVEYGVRYRYTEPLWKGRGEERTEAVSDGSLDRAEFAAHGFMTLGFSGIQIVKREPGGDWVLHRKVSPGREIVRKFKREG